MCFPNHQHANHVSIYEKFNNLKVIFWKVKLIHRSLARNKDLELSLCIENSLVGKS